MKRTVAGILLAPLIWPFIEVYMAGVMYILLTGITIEISWNVGFHNLHRYWWGYGFMFTCGVPFIALCKKYNWNKLWVFLTGSSILALIAPLVYWVGGAIIFEPQHVTLPGIKDLVLGGTHIQFAGVITSIIMFTIFWLISVKNNEWYAT